MENQPTPASPLPPTAPSTTTTAPLGTSEWPAVPPAPAPVKPAASLLGPEPPIINPDVHLISPAPDPATAATAGPPAASGTTVTSVAPVTALPAVVGTATVSNVRSARVPRPTRPLLPVAVGPDEESPLAALQRSVRRQGGTRDLVGELIWQPRFAFGSALVIVLAYLAVTLPLWILLYRQAFADTASARDILALCMMLLGGFLTGAAAWVVIIEMRGRVRMVDTLARSGDREVAPASPELPVLDAPLDRLVMHPIGAPPPPIGARVEAQQVSAAATLEASSKLLASFSSVLKSFGQLPAQVAMLTVALGLFVGATFLSL